MEGKIKTADQAIKELLIPSQPKKLGGASSVLLDALRFSAAMIVFFAHARGIWFGTWKSDLLASRLSHGAVIIFFVLSGYVIAYTTSIKKRGWVEYATARLSRLYSVFLPAIVFTMLVSLLARHADPVLFAQYERGHEPLRYLLSSAFCNEIWFFSAAPLINGPIWSLSYEFWFYVLFGCWLFKGKSWKGWLFLLIMAACAGPKILLMMPIWLMGCLAYLLPCPKISGRWRWAWIGLPLLLAPLLMILLPAWPFPVDTPPLFWAGQFITDAVVGCCIAVAFWLLPSQLAQKNETKGVALFRQIADLTFPIYVFHFPCLVACKAFIHSGDKTRDVMISFGVTLIFCAIMGFFLERKRPAWQIFFQKLCALLGGMVRKLAI